MTRDAHTVDCPTCGAPATALCVKLSAGDGAEVQMDRVHKERGSLVGINDRGASTCVARLR